jgi:hypothetical protein
VRSGDSDYVGGGGGRRVIIVVIVVIKLGTHSEKQEAEEGKGRIVGGLEEERIFWKRWRSSRE